MVAYHYGLSAPGFKEALVVVRDLHTGKTRHRVPSGPLDSPEEVGVGPLTALIVKSDGAVAWVVESRFEPSAVANGMTSGHEYTVYALDKTGERQLAVGTDIAPESLALKGSTLYWTQAGKASSAVLN